MLKNHFQTRLTSPLVSISMGYAYILSLAIILYKLGFYENSPFFRWGTPLKFMNVDITDDSVFYIMLLFFFIHQLINNWINEVTYPWIINCIQDPKNKNIVYSKKTSILIINMFAIYSELDVVLIVSGIMSQISFFSVIILANIITGCIINLRYINLKNVDKYFSEYEDEYLAYNYV